MAVSRNDAVFRLPSKFLIDDDVLLDKENAPLINNNVLKKPELKPSLSFPSEFPYEFDSIDSALSSPVDSVVCSTETESSNNTSDEDDFLAGLTRRLTHSSTQKLAVPGRLPQDKDKLESWVMAGSPESTLSGIGSWSVSSSGSPNGSSLVSSPPTTPFGGQNDTWDLISAAAGQVARLKMNSEGARYNNNIVHGRGLLGAPKNPSPVHVVKNPNFGLYSSQNVNYNIGINQYQQFVKQEQMLKTRCGVVRGSQAVRPAWPSQPQQQQQQIQSKARNIVYENARCGRPLGLSQSAWPSLQVQPQQHKPVFVGGSGVVKRECAGTGVFLPRRYENNPLDSRKKSGCSTVLVSAKVVQALNLNFDDMNGNGQAPQRFNSAFGPHYDALMARRSAVMTLQKQRNLRPDLSALNHHEIHLPQEWTY